MIKVMIIFNDSGGAICYNRPHQLPRLACWTEVVLAHLMFNANPQHTDSAEGANCTASFQLQSG